MVVLGQPWLKLHNPHIDWAKAIALNWNSFCHWLLLLSTPVKLPDLSSVPVVYHELGKVFSKQHALSLPPHRLYDCDIELLPSAPLPTSRLYNRSKLEREAMKNILRFLFFLFVPPPLHLSFFVKKKDKPVHPCIDFQDLNDIMINSILCRLKIQLLNLSRKQLFSLNLI